MAQIWQFTAQDPYESMQAGMDQARKNRLGDIDVAEKARAYETSKVVNALYSKLIDPVTGQIDRNRLYGEIAKSGYGGAVPVMQRSQAELEEKQAKAIQDRASAAKALSDVEAATVKANRDALAPVTNQEGWDVWRARAKEQYKNVPNIDQVFDRIIPPQFSLQNKFNALQLADTILPKGEIRKIGGATVTIDPYTGKKIGAEIADVPLPENVFKQEVAKAVAGKSSVNVGVNTSKKFGETISEGAGKRLDSLRDNAEQSVRAIETNKRLKPLLDDPKFISGTFADARTAVARALGVDVSATETFFSGMAEQVASRIKAFGAGTGLSDEDRKYALAWAGGKPDLSAKGIARIMRINDQSSNYAVEKYNQERQFLGKKEPSVFDYYPEITNEIAGNDQVDTSNPLLK